LNSWTVTIATRTCAIGSDLVVLIVTWYHTYGVIRSYSKETHSAKPTLAKLLLKDGTLYFLALFLVNVADILDFLLANGALFNLSTFILPMSSILTSRFLLHVRKAAYTTINVGFGTERPSFVRSRTSQNMPSQMSSIAFAAVNPANTGIATAPPDASQTAVNTDDADLDHWWDELDDEYLDDEGDEMVEMAEGPTASVVDTDCRSGDRSAPRVVDYYVV